MSIAHIGEIWFSEYNKHENPKEMLEDKYVYILNKEGSFYVTLKVAHKNKEGTITGDYQVEIPFVANPKYKCSYVNCTERRYISERRLKYKMASLSSLYRKKISLNYERAVEDGWIETAKLEQMLFDLGYDSIEEMSGGGGPVIGMEINDKTVQSYSPGMFIIDFGPKDKFKDDGDFDYGYAVANDYYAKKIYRTKNGKIVKEDTDSFLDGRNITIYRYIGEDANWLSLLKIINENTIEGIDDTFFFEHLTGNPMRIHDQFNYDKNFKVVNLKELYLLSTMQLATLNEEAKELTGDPMLYFPVMSDKDLELQRIMQSNLGEHYKLMEDTDGYYLFNEASNQRSKSVKREFIENMF